MALPTARPLLRSCRGLICCRNLLLLLLGLGWMPVLQVQATKTGQEAALLRAERTGTPDFTSLPAGLFLGLTCEELSGLSMAQAQALAVAGKQKNITLRADQLRCLAHRLPKHLTSEELDALPLDLLLFLNPAMFRGQQACVHFFSLISKANVDLLPQRSLERQRLLPRALECQGVHNFQVSEADVKALGGLVCDLPGEFVIRSSEILLPWLAGCRGPLNKGQEEAVREALRSGRSPYGPPSKWSVSTLDALQGLLAVLDESIVHSIPKTYPQGYPESLIQQLGHFFRYISPEDIHRWNVTSPETVKTLLKVTKGQKMDAQVTALIACYLRGGGHLDQDIVKALEDIPLAFLCDFKPEDLHSIPSSFMWLVKPQDLNKCSLRHLDVLYQKACLAFQNTSRQEYFEKIRTFLGGASVEDLRTLSQQNLSMDLATFKKLQVDALVGLTVTEVQRLLGPHIVGLKTEEDKSPVRDWLLQQRQEDLDRLGLGLQGGIPNGYLVLDLNVREAFSSGAPLLGPGFIIAWIPALLSAFILS